MKSAIAVVDWFGPYSLKEARKCASDYDDGVYMAIGKCAKQSKTRLQYFGLTSNVESRMKSNHHSLSLITQELSLWLGEIASPRSSGKKIKVIDRMLDLVEWAHIYTLHPPLNDKKTVNPPDRSITIYNRWWQKDYETPYKKRPHRGWPDLIDYMGDEFNEGMVKLVWFGGRQEITSIDEF